jgi:uncharacterized protein DUF6868
MDIEVVRHALLWCTIINYGLLIFWFGLYVLAHTWVHRLWGFWFRLTTAQFDAINFAGMMIYKLGILLFNLVPYVALVIVR